MKKSISFGLAILVAFHVSLSVVMAADIAREVRVGEASPESSDGGFLEIGGGPVYWKTPVRGEDDGGGISIFLGGRYQWRGLFVEAIEGSSTLASIGYNAWNNDHWSVDILASALNDGIISEDNDELSSLQERDGDFLLGGRATGYFDNYILQLQLQRDISDTHDGVIASVEGGKSWQVRNWNFHTLLGFKYHTGKVVDYYLGVRPEEATASLPAFKADAGSLLTAEIGVTYPMSEHWVFRSTASYEHLTENLTESPVIDGENVATLTTSFSYVF